ncbi:hypothetical protein [Pseudomarimonas salicorniae]|uniref:Lipoprotein n=1 Tax=Pseudomarimonas salicorniae TaxID=2933270 RepID=A0ABT0GM66_9GAMM|nr:hypothetical protein [Lysobacter sp. CAU 1642]MCK7595304.1 hypothetical protein [Lysobacter sp. CAU 1642]
MKPLAAIALVAFLVGCSPVQPVKPVVYEPASATSERRLDATYEIGVPKEVFVGDQMLRVQDYHVVTRDTGSHSTRLTPTQDFKVRLPPFATATVDKGDIVRVEGVTERDGRSYRLVELPDPTAGLLRFLIDEEGGFEGSALNNQGARMGWSYKPEPSTVRLVPAPSSVRIDTTKGFTNFELVYGGTTRDSFQILYREYSRDDLARPAFTQNLVYEKGGEPVIRFRNLKIEVQEASNDRIRFVVIEDGGRG